MSFVSCYWYYSGHHMLKALCDRSLAFGHWRCRYWGDDLLTLNTLCHIILSNRVMQPNRPSLSEFKDFPNKRITSASLEWLHLCEILNCSLTLKCFVFCIPNIHANNMDAISCSLYKSSKQALWVIFYIISNFDLF